MRKKKAVCIDTNVRPGEALQGHTEGRCKMIHHQNARKTPHKATSEKQARQKVHQNLKLFQKMSPKLALIWEGKK